MGHDPKALNRRGLIAATAAFGAAALASPALALTNSTEIENDISSSVSRNVSSFRALDWRPYFSDLRNGAILADTQSRAVHFWSADESVYRLYPSSVPLTPDLTRLGRTEIIKKVDGPDWRPTPSMRERNPEWPEYIPAGPDSPLGTHAMWLTWQYYRIHGTHDTRKIGRRSSNGCIGLYNEHIAELFALSTIGTQVMLI
ncbi:L,D-transpeptidase [uncultured Limimaricola sp.]|uniref:L,D-transpeptidase n=1 Tax=uncultured Limimaricola sp. TaxID=2211667 RepID=UPI0030FB39B2